MKTLEEGQVYRNKKLREIDMMVLTVYADEPEYLKVSVSWVSKFYKDTCWIDTITIKRSDLEHWVKVPGAGLL